MCFISSFQFRSHWLTYSYSLAFLPVIRILLGQIPGNVLFGVLLHTIRLITFLLVLPYIPLDQTWLISSILGTYAITEISRYPMYIFKGKISRLIRMCVPMITFPIGCASEAYGSYIILTTRENLSIFGKLPLLFVLFINGVLGPYMAFPHVLKKYVYIK